MLSSTKTFCIPELLETILEFAEPQDLLLWQRVNTTWEAVIQRSPRIQEKLFFRAKSRKDCSGEEYTVWNPLLDFFSDCPIFPWHVITSNAFSGKASCPTASWRRMFIASPAPTELKVLKFDKEDKNLKRGELIACEAGITIGQLADAQRKEFAFRPDGSEVECIWVARIRD